jgi:hypothetical protein
MGDGIIGSTGRIGTVKLVGRSGKFGTIPLEPIRELTKKHAE